jgi:hypothetical protein
MRKRAAPVDLPAARDEDDIFVRLQDKIMESQKFKDESI